MTGLAELVLVKGVAVARDGALIGSLPGTLLRAGSDTDAVVP